MLDFLDKVEIIPETDYAYTMRPMKNFSQGEASSFFMGSLSRLKSSEKQLTISLKQGIVYFHLISEVTASLTMIPITPSEWILTALTPMLMI